MSVFLYLCATYEYALVEEKENRSKMLAITRLGLG